MAAESGVDSDIPGVRFWGLGFGVWGAGFRVWGLGFKVQGLGFRVRGLGAYRNLQTPNPGAMNAGRRGMGSLLWTAVLLVLIFYSFAVPWWSFRAF